MQDVKVWITDREGVQHKVMAPTDMAMNLMEVIRTYELVDEGTIGICGGIALCASCQCYITSEHQLKDMEYDEDAMLAEAFHVQENSRLTCQIPITEDLDGLALTLAREV